MFHQWLFEIIPMKQWQTFINGHYSNVSAMAVRNYSNVSASVLKICSIQKQQAKIILIDIIPMFQQ
jgi:hypothetical protein